MNYAIEGVYKNGSIELIEKPEFRNPVQVLVLFLENKNKIRKLGGLFKDFDVDYGYRHKAGQPVISKSFIAQTI